MTKSFRGMAGLGVDDNDAPMLCSVGKVPVTPIKRRSMARTSEEEGVLHEDGGILVWKLSQGMRKLTSFSSHGQW